MLYRIIGEEVTTHRRVEIPNWDAPDITTAKRLAAQIGVVVSRIEPMNALTPATHKITASQESIEDERGVPTIRLYAKSNAEPATTSLQWNEGFSKDSLSVAGCICLVLLVLVIGSFNRLPGTDTTSSSSLTSKLASATCAIFYTGNRIGNAISDNIELEQVTLRKSLDQELKMREQQTEAAIREGERRNKEVVDTLRRRFGIETSK